MPTEFIVGSEILLSAAFFDAAGAPKAPTTITLYVKRDGQSTVTSYVFGTDAILYTAGVGIYYRAYTPSVAGKYYYKWTGTGALVTASEGSFVVQSTNI